MSKSSGFRLKLASLQQGKRYRELSFRTYMKGEQFDLTDPIMKATLGETLDYGKLFAYCFRRFGYPNMGWDNYKQHSRYILTTPRKDMVLNVVPYMDNDTAITFSFLVSDLEALQAIENYAQRDRLAWTKAAFEHAESLGLPDRMNEWLEFCNKEIAPLYRPAGFSTWVETAGFAHAWGEPGAEDGTYAKTKEIEAYFENIIVTYQDVTPYPSYIERSEDWTSWNEEDPLKAYAEAAFVALNDLKRPVGVRDMDINAMGLVEEGKVRGGVARAAVAGKPSGALGNAAPDEFAELHGLIFQLGKGNAKRGIQKALAILKDQKKPKKTKVKDAQ